MLVCVTSVAIDCCFCLLFLFVVIGCLEQPHQRSANMPKTAVHCSAVGWAGLEGLECAAVCSLAATIRAGTVATLPTACRCDPSVRTRLCATNGIERLQCRRPSAVVAASVVHSGGWIDMTALHGSWVHCSGASAAISNDRSGRHPHVAPSALALLVCTGRALIDTGEQHSVCDWQERSEARTAAGSRPISTPPSGAALQIHSDSCRQRSEGRQTHRRFVGPRCSVVFCCTQQLLLPLIPNQRFRIRCLGRSEFGLLI